ncbi:MAG TPA: helicase HerA-like domain-containing protein, partial [Polyangiaceae bacterium]|nr:helicase HerA-like domain-containing protein [Polyangiaceae bacterium]
MAQTPPLYLGASRPLSGVPEGQKLLLPAHHLTTHGVIVGMTGSGKTGLVTVLVEEALSAGVPVLMIDVKGDLPNLLLSFPSLGAESLLPWVDGASAPNDERQPAEIAAALANERAAALQSWGIGTSELERYHSSKQLRVITPGSTAGERLHMLSALERANARWDDDPESARAGLAAAVSLVLRLLGRDSDPARSKEHVLLSLLAERRLRNGQSAELGALLQDLEVLPITEVGALPVERFVAKKDRQALAAALNSLLASPTFGTWREGATLDVGEWLTPEARSVGGRARTPGVIVSVAHLDDEERALVLGVLLEELLSWVRSLAGSRKLRALVVFDEVYGFMPPHPSNPPTKRPLVALMKQARAFGVGVVVATQNPMDLDYRALSNAGLWCIGRLQTDADRTRVIDGLADSSRTTDHLLEDTIKHIAPRWFVVRDVHQSGAPV